MKATKIVHHYTSPTGDVISGQSTVDWERSYATGWRHARCYRGGLPRVFPDGAVLGNHIRTGYDKGFHDYDAHRARNVAAGKGEG